MRCVRGLRGGRRRCKTIKGCGYEDGRRMRWRKRVREHALHTKLGEWGGNGRCPNEGGVEPMAVQRHNLLPCKLLQCSTPEGLLESRIRMQKHNVASANVVHLLDTNKAQGRLPIDDRRLKGRAKKTKTNQMRSYIGVSPEAKSSSGGRTRARTIRRRKKTKLSKKTMEAGHE